MKQIFKSTLLLGILTGIFLVVGYAIGGRSGMYLALGFSALTNFGAYWFSDKLVLSMQGAKAVSKSDAPELYSIIQELSIVENMPEPKIYVVNSPIPNAFATGRSPSHAAVAATTGIMELLTRDELRGVLAHELGHVKNRDILVSTIAATAAGAISVMAQLAYFGGGFMGGGDRDRNPIGMLATLILAPLSATLIQLAITRSREYLADEHGAKMIGSGEPLAAALSKLRDFKEGHKIPASPSDQATAHMMFVNMFSAGGLTNLFSTHPNIDDRIKRLRQM